MKLIDVINSTISGDWGSENCSSDTPCAVNCIRSADIVPYYNHVYDGVPIRYISESSYRTRKLIEGDIIIEKSGGTNDCSTGRPMYVSDKLLSYNPELVCSNFCTALRIKKGWNSKYIYYFLRYIHGKGVFHHFEGKTSGIHNLQIENAFRAIEMPNLTFEEQEKIADILTNIENKTFLNLIQNETLEKIAKLLYDYWFVQFDFPDENGRPYKSSGGAMVYNEQLKREIPKGWEVKKLIEISNIVNGATPSTSDSENYGGDIIWITPKDLSDQGQKFVFHGARSITKKGYDSCSTSMLPKGSILMSSRAPIGLFAIAQTDMCTNQGFKSFKLKDEQDSIYLYYYLKQHIKQIEQLGTGTTFKEVSREDLKNFKVLYISDRDLYHRWVEHMSIIFKKQAKLQAESEVLQELLSTIMPLLITGQAKLK